MIAAQNLAVGSSNASFATFNSGTTLISLQVGPGDVYCTFDGTTPSATNGGILFSNQTYNWNPQTAQHATFKEAGISSTIYAQEMVVAGPASQMPDVEIWKPRVANQNDSRSPYWVNVVSFGADPTGTKDSTVAIQNAINSLPAGIGTGEFPTNVCGGTVYFPSGTYNISAHITITEGVTLLGNGKYSSIINNINVSGDDAIRIQNNNRSSGSGTYFANVVDLQVNGNSSSGCGIKNYTSGLLSVNYCRYSGLLVQNNGLDGFYDQQAVGGFFYDCYFLQNLRYGVWLADVSTVSTAHVFIGCEFRVNGSVATNGAGVYDQSNASTFLGKNVFESNPYGPGLIASGTGCNYDGCYFENNEYVGQATSYLRDQISIQGYGNTFREIFLATGRIHFSNAAGGTNYNQLWCASLVNLSPNPNILIDTGCANNQILYTNPLVSPLVTDNDGSNFVIDYSGVSAASGAGSATWQAPIFISTVGTGQAPFQVSSTTIVANLNVTYWNGNKLTNKGQFSMVSGSASVSGLTLTGSSVIIPWLATASGTISAAPYATAIAATSGTCTIKGGVLDNSTYNFCVIN